MFKSVQCSICKKLFPDNDFDLHLKKCSDKVMKKEIEKFKEKLKKDKELPMTVITSILLSDTQALDTMKKGHICEDIVTRLYYRFQGGEIQCSLNTIWTSAKLCEDHRYAKAEIIRGDYK